jgi:3-keto-5-aminohexanoate cleavage enzyme
VNEVPRQKKLIVEIRANEYEMRDANPNVPWAAAEIAEDAVRCRDAGASIIHFHARKSDGAPAFGAEAYREAVAAIRERSDILIHTTLGGPDRAASADDRIAHIVKLSEQGYRPDFVPLDMGTSNIDTFDTARRSFRSDEAVYVNTTRTLKQFAETLARLGIKPYLQIWNVPMLRWVTAFVMAGFVQPPLFVNFTMSSDRAFLAVHPGTAKGLNAYLDFLPDSVPIEWGATLAGDDIAGLAEMIIDRGGHISVGLGDYAYGGLKNWQVADRIVRLATKLGCEIATPADVKRMLAMSA